MSRNEVDGMDRPERNEYSPAHPHEPEIPPALAPDGHCRVCRLIVERDEARQQLRGAVEAERENVAKVLYTESPPEFEYPWDRATDEDREPYFEAADAVLRALDHPRRALDRYHENRYEELRGWVTEALNLPGAPYGEARQVLLSALRGVTRQQPPGAVDVTEIP